MKGAVTCVLLWKRSAWTRPNGRLCPLRVALPRLPGLVKMLNRDSASVRLSVCLSFWLAAWLAACVGRGAQGWTIFNT